MSEFEFFFSFFGLLLGLSVAEVVVKLADAIGIRHRLKLGWLTPMLAIFVLIDISSFWMWTWANRELAAVTWAVVFGGLAVAVTYFVSAALVFPRRPEEWVSLDEHYWANKRLVFAGIMAANAVVVAVTLIHAPPSLSDWILFVFQAVYWLPMAALLFTRSQRVDLMLLGVLIVGYIVVSLNPFQSNWGAAVGL